MKTAIFERPDWENWNISIPLIQGGMGVGVSLSGLAGAGLPLDLPELVKGSAGSNSFCSNRGMRCVHGL